MAICNDEISNTCDDRYALRSLRKQLENHFGKDIAFQSRYRRNESSIVFFPKHGGAYIESAINSWGMDITDLIRNLAKILFVKYKKNGSVPCHAILMNF